MRSAIFLFGEAEKGDYCCPLLCKSVAQLADTLGNPPQDSQGIPYAIQALLYERRLLFYRVREEGFSLSDYLRGLHLLEHSPPREPIAALCMPGMGEADILEAASRLCRLQKSLLILSEKDLYDYLTGAK